MTKHTDSSRGVSGNAQTGAREIRKELERAKEFLLSDLELDGYTPANIVHQRAKLLLSECSRLASRVEELENLIAKHSLAPEPQSTQLGTAKGESMTKEIRYKWTGAAYVPDPPITTEEAVAYLRSIGIMVEYEPALTMVDSLEHTRSCPALTPLSDDDCTCGLYWRGLLRTEQEMHAAWRKRAEECEWREQTRKGAKHDNS